MAPRLLAAIRMKAMAQFGTHVLLASFVLQACATDDVESVASHSSGEDGSDAALQQALPDASASASSDTPHRDAEPRDAAAPPDREAEASVMSTDTWDVVLCDITTTHQCFNGIVVAYMGECGNSPEWLWSFDGGLTIEPDAAAISVRVMECPFGCLDEGADIMNWFDPTPDELYGLACAPADGGTT